MPEKIYIQKASGITEPFNLDKFRRSLKRAGASEALVEQIVREVKEMRPTSTQEIHEYATRLLTQKSPPTAARYNIKKALIEMGPAGFPFEKFIANLFQEEGYTTEQGRICQGACVAHEIDVIATRGDERLMIECKFHNVQTLKSNVKVTLYVKARFDDIHQAWKLGIEPHELHQAWLATN